MKKLPYKTCFVVMKLNGSVRKIFFSGVENFDNYSNFNFDDHLQFIAKNTVDDDSNADNLFMLCCESYLNTKEAIKMFKADAKNKCFLKSQMCVILIFDVNADENNLNIQISLSAHDENSGAFNDIAALVSDKTMTCFVEGLSVEQQDLLFEFVNL